MKREEKKTVFPFALCFLFSLSHFSLCLSIRRTDSAVADQAEAEDLLHSAALLARRALRLCSTTAAAAAAVAGCRRSARRGRHDGMTSDFKKTLKR
jgi:hypothetical protein